jgi:hypothetical protein
MMSRYGKLQLAVAVVLSVICTSMGYELKALSPSLPVPAWVVIVASLWGGGFLAPFLSTSLMKWRWARRIFLGSEWLEGVWIVSTFEGGTFIATSLAILSYDSTTMDLLVTTRTIGPGQDRRISASQMASVTKQGGHLHYVSVFTSQTHETSFIGLAVGSALKEPDSWHPTRYEGRIYYMDGRTPRSESGRRVPISAVRKAKKRFPSSWEDELIRLHKQGPESLTPARDLPASSDTV